MEVSGKTFLVTGGGSGLGAATARELVGAGGRVIVADVDSEAGTAWRKGSASERHSSRPT